MPFTVERNDLAFVGGRHYRAVVVYISRPKRLFPMASGDMRFPMPLSRVVHSVVFDNRFADLAMVPGALSSHHVRLRVR